MSTRKSKVVQALLVAGRRGFSIREMADVLRDLPSNLNQPVKELIQEGTVIRKEDKRKCTISGTLSYVHVLDLYNRY